MTFRKALEEKRECCGVPFGLAHAPDCKRNEKGLWTRISEQKPPIGSIIRLQLRDALGTYDGRSDCFLHEDGEYYNIDPPARVRRELVYAWRPSDDTDARLSDT